MLSKICSDFLIHCCSSRWSFWATTSQHNYLLWDLMTSPFSPYFNLTPYTLFFQHLLSHKDFDQHQHNISTPPDYNNIKNNIRIITPILLTLCGSYTTHLPCVLCDKQSSRQSIQVTINPHTHQHLKPFDASTWDTHTLGMTSEHTTKHPQSNGFPQRRTTTSPPPPHQSRSFSNHP